MKASRIIAVGFSLISFVLAACGSSAPTESPATPDASTKTVAEVAAETERPTATATPAKEQFEIIESFGWIDETELGDYFVEMLVLNPYDHPVWIVETSKVEILDSSGKILVDGAIYSGDGLVMGGLGYVLPGETIPASSCLSCLNDEKRQILQGLGDSWIDTLSITFVLEPADPVAAANNGSIWASPSFDFEVEVISFSYIGNNVFTIDGIVENTGDRPVRSAFVRIILYDPDGNYVGWGEASVFGEFFYTEEGYGEFKDVSPGANVEFTAFLRSPVIDVPLDYEITVIGKVEEE